MKVVGDLKRSLRPLIIYAKYCCKAFEDWVKLWIIINEPYVVATHGCGKGIAPATTESCTRTYKAVHNLIKAHAKAWHSYDKIIRENNVDLCL